MEAKSTDLSAVGSGKEMLFSKMIRAGSRVYYIDVKKSSTGDILMTITESKKTSAPGEPLSKGKFERHKLFVYQEDLLQFKKAVDEAIEFIDREKLISYDTLRRHIE